MNKMDVNEAGMNETGKTPNPAVPRTVQVGAGIFTAVIVGLLIWQVLKPSGSSQTLGKLEGDMHSLMFTTDGRVLYGQHGGIQSSSDGGQTWTDPGGQGDAMGLGASGETMYLAGHDVFQKSTDGGKTWTSPGFGNLPATDIHGFAVGPSNGWLYANLAGAGLHRSTDGGKTWQPLSAATADAMALAVGSGTPPKMYAATMRDLTRSQDGGVNWQPVPNASNLLGMALAVDPTNNAVYASSGSGVVRSADDGETWTETGGPGEALALIAVNPKDSAHLMTISGTGQVYSSVDAGKTWKGK